MTALFILIDPFHLMKGAFRRVIWLGWCLFFEHMDDANYSANSAKTR